MTSRRGPRPRAPTLGLPKGPAGSFATVTAEVLDAMEAARHRTLALVSHLDEAELERVLTPILSPLAWDLGHIAAYEDLWLNHRLARRALLRPGLAELYDAFETPRAVRGEREFLRGDELRTYLAEVRARTLDAPVGNGILHEMVLRHEGNTRRRCFR